MRPEVGCALDRYLFETVDRGALTAIRGAVSDALIYYEPRIQVNRVEVNPDPEEAGLLIISIDYTTRRTNTRSNLVYPFYIGEATAIDI